MAGEEGGESVSAQFPGAQADADLPPLILPGGKVNPDAIRAAYEHAAERGREAADGEEPVWKVTFNLQRDLRTRLDKYLTSRITFMSRSGLQRLIETGGVTINGREARSATKLRAGDRVDVVVPPPPSKDVLAQDIPLNVLYEDEHLIALNKQPDIIVHPARAEKSGTLINALAWHFKHRSETGGELSPVGTGEARPGVVHRLDRDTTGCIVFAKTEAAHWKLGRQWEERTADKRYLAVCHGRFRGALNPAEGEAVDVIDEPLGPHPSKEKGYREKQVVRRDDLGKHAVTIARPRERYNTRGPADPFTLLELELKTGRTHQIRVHLAHRNCPIVGDDMYGGRPIDLPDGTRIERQMLHAALLAIDHPITGAPIVLTAPPPPDMRALIEHLRTGECDRVEPPGAVALGRFGL